MKKGIRNFTPHTVNFLLKSGHPLCIPSEGVARVAVTQKAISRVILLPFNVAVPTFASTFGEVEGLPKEELGVLLIVSRMVKAACPKRTDLLCPSGLIRDDEGKVIGCKGLEV